MSRAPITKVGDGAYVAADAYQRYVLLYMIGVVLDDEQSARLALAAGGGNDTDAWIAFLQKRTACLRAMRRAHDDIRGAHHAVVPSRRRNKAARRARRRNRG